MYVALRKESVDRNAGYRRSSPLTSQSLSARRAWIEMPNLSNMEVIKLSLSARRAWIEIGCWLPDHSWWLRVALRKESVDRNAIKLSPLPHICWSLSARRAWIEIRW